MNIERSLYDENYTILHLHTDYSTGTTNIDSVTKPIDYIKRASELKMKAIAFTEHGNLFDWSKKKKLCEEYNLKYIHGIECYITETLEEKVRDNYHCCLYAKNFEGVKELNKLITKSFSREDNHFYYVPRISIDELVNTSNNIIVSSACIGGIFSKGNEEIQKKYLDFFIENKDRCYLELQHHLDNQQKELNKKLYDLSLKYDLKLTIGTDTHALSNIHAKGRSILQKSKNIRFENESNWDITFKTYNELINLYKEQNAIPMEVIIEALKNTNRIADQIEEFKIDRSYKYPQLWNNPEELLNDKIKKGIKRLKLDKKENFQSEYVPRIKEELETYKHNKAINFLLIDEDIKSYGKRNNMFAGYSRGSVAGSLIAYIIGMTDMDSIKHKLNFQRFMNTERVSLADVDTDWSPKDRDKIKEYIYSKTGLYCADIITFNTVALKGSIRDVCRALYIKEVPQWLKDRYDEECEHLGQPMEETRKKYEEFKYGDYLKIANYICENVDIKEEQMRKEYPEVFEYVDIINGTIVSVGTHPCGLIVSPIPLDETIGLTSLSTCDYPVSMLNMKEIDYQNFVKLDLLGLDNITLINETCKLANIERLTPDNVDVEDEKVWKSIRDDTLGIFQWEGTGERYIKDLFSDETIKRIKEKNKDFKYIDLFSVGNGAIRPAGASYRDNLAKGIFKDNGHKALNDLLASTLGYLIYQEQVLDFLHVFCGYTMGEADIIRRGFAKKIGTEQYIPEIKKGFIKTMNEKYNTSKEDAESIVKDFLTVIEDASSYLFSLNHSCAYSYIGYICGYLRYYYPLEFLSVAFNIYEDDIEKTKKIYDYATKRGIKLANPKFRYSRSDYFMDKDTNTIYKGIASIKYLNKSVGEFLYSIKDNTYETFTDLLIDINKQINSKQLTILINLDFFEEFGKSNKLLKIYENFDNFYNKSQINKEKYLEWNDILKEYATKETAKLYKFDDTLPMLRYMEELIPDEDINIVDKVKCYFENTGSCDIKDDKRSKQYIVLDINVNYTPKVQLYSLSTSKTDFVKIGKKVFRNNPLAKYDLIYLDEWNFKNKRKKGDDGKWIELDQKEIWATKYWKI